MAIREELELGLERLKEIFESRRILRLSEPTALQGRMAYYFLVRAFEKEWDFTLSWETLSDLPSMKAYQDSASRLARILEKRFTNFSPALFVCKSGRAVFIEAEWPMEALPNRAASWIRVVVRDFETGDVALCFVVVTHGQSIFELKTDPFAIHEATVNSIRDTVDQAKVTFYPRKDHPISLQEVQLSLDMRPHASTSQIDEFIGRKVFWLGFKADNPLRRVWIPDPWDASYLGSTPRELLQATHILAARGDIIIDDAGEFGTTGKGILTRARELEKRTVETHSVKVQTRSWDLFISHATEDKEIFVRPLARLLQQRGLQVWFDEFSLTLGDSLRRSIDEGLAKSRFGVVVLSPEFFAKEWPQKELDALVGRESGGTKVILPVWHNISVAGVRQFSPLLADRFAVSSAQGIAVVADRIVGAVAKVEGESQ